MSKFRIMTHGRLQEWVAEEKGYFNDEGLDYQFVGTPEPGSQTKSATVQAAAGDSPDGSTTPNITRGQFESYEDGRACEVSSACHWAVGMAASAQHGLMWRHAYSVTPAGIYVPPDSPIQKPIDLANVEVGVGYHSGSHFSALQALEKILKPEEINLRFIGGANQRLHHLLERNIGAANIFGMQRNVVEQHGFHRIVDTTFMIGFLISRDTDKEEVAKYFNALQRAQRDIDLEPERYKHYFLKELPEEYHSQVDVRAFGPGERLVFEPYTREMYERTHRWMQEWNLFPEGQVGDAPYQEAVSV